MSLFSTRDDIYHREQKKVVAGAYRMSSLLEMEDAVDSCSTLFTQRLDGFATTGEAFDLGVSALLADFRSSTLYAYTVARPGSNTMPSTLLARSLSTKSSASLNKART